MIQHDAYIYRDDVDDYSERETESRVGVVVIPRAHLHGHIDRP